MSSKKNWIKSSETVAPLPLSPFRNDVLAGKVVLITGGATGIGYAIAETFGKHGCKVAIMSRRKKVIMDAVQKLRNRGIDAFGTTVDVRDSQRCVNSVNEVAAQYAWRARRDQYLKTHTNGILTLI